MAGNVHGPAMWRNLKNVSRQPMLNKITKVENKNPSQICNAQPGQKMIDS
jgi:hypothetical protein